MSLVFGLLSKEDSRKVPLKSIKNHVDVQGFTADVTATLEYKNDEEKPIEAIFVFPLDEQAAVCGFQATVDGRTIVAEVQEKQEARDTYDDAISSGHSAFLLEESDESSDIFQISVGNLPPKKSATVELRFITELEVQEGGQVVFVLPSVLNPRYTPEGSAASLSSTTIPAVPAVASVDSMYTFDFELTVNSASEIREITSPSNSLAVQLDADKSRAEVRLDQAHIFDKDVVVHIMTSEPFKPHALVEKGTKLQSTENKNDFFTKDVVMLNFLPEFESSEDSPSAGEFVFIVDRSGSMSGDSIKSAGETLLLFLKSLPDGCYFNVIGFGSSFTKLFNKSQLYDDKTLKVACQSSENLKADLGGTEILQPLQWVFSQPSIKGHPRQVFLLTDGGVGNTEQVIAEVRQNASTTRCFTFGVGHGVSTALVKGVARAGKGTAEFVKPGERMQKKVIKTLKHALQPVLNDVTVTWDLAAELWELQQSPTSLPPIFLGDRLVVYGLLGAVSGMQGPLRGSARLRYTLNKKQLEHTIEFNVSDVGNKKAGSATLHRLAAKCFIQEKQDKQVDVDERDKSSIISISKSSNVVSKHTSFVAVDRDSREPVSGPLQQRRVPRYDMLLSLSSKGLLCASAQPCSAFSAPMKKSKGSGLGSLFGGEITFRKKSRCRRKAATSAPRPAMAAPASAMTAPDDDSEEAEDCLDVSVPFSGRSKKLEHQDTVVRLITLQKASGAWEFSDQFASVCGLASSVLLQSCPESVRRETPADKSLWATALALGLLAGKFLDRQDEWEMIAEKGKRWLKSNLPKSVKYGDVLQAAAKGLGVQLPQEF